MSCNVELIKEFKANFDEVVKSAVKEEYVSWLYLFAKRHICFDLKSECRECSMSVEDKNVSMLKNLLSKIKDECEEKSIVTRRDISKNINFITLRFCSEEYGTYLIQVSFIDGKGNDQFCISYMDPTYNLEPSHIIDLA